MSESQSKNKKGILNITKKIERILVSPKLKGRRRYSRKVYRRLLRRRIRNDFLTGLLVIVPVSVTIIILEWVFQSLDNILQPIIRVIWGRNLPGAGFAVMIILIFLVGLITSNVVGERLVSFLESPLRKIPVLRTIYLGIKQILKEFSSNKKRSFRQVVLVEYPRAGIKSLGFVTNITTDATGDKTYYVLIPTAPNPTSGFLVVVTEKDIIPTHLSVDDAIGVIVSAGTFSQKDMEQLQGEINAVKEQEKEKKKKKK